MRRNRSNDCTTIFQLRAHWVRISWSIGSEKIVRTCAPGGSRTLDFLHARRARYPLSQALRSAEKLVDVTLYIALPVPALGSVSFVKDIWELIFFKPYGEFGLYLVLHPLKGHPGCGHGYVPLRCEVGAGRKEGRRSRYENWSTTTTTISNFFLKLTTTTFETQMMD